MIAIDLSKQQALDTDPQAIQQINFTGDLENNAVIIFIDEEAKETVLDFSPGFFFLNCKSILIFFFSFFFFFALI